MCTFQGVAHALTFRDLVSTPALARQQLQHCLGSWRSPQPFHGELAIVISDPATLDWAWDLRMLLETACPDASLVVSGHGMHEEAILQAGWKLDRLELPTPCAENLVAGCVGVQCCCGYSLHVNAWSFLNRSADDSHDFPQLVKLFLTML